MAEHETVLDWVTKGSDEDRTRIRVDLNGLEWICMGWNGSEWVGMDLNGSRWSGSKWIP